MFASVRIQEFRVIDGQQRLTTLSLLILALSRAIEKRRIDIGITRKQLLDYYLFNAHEEGELRYKLLLTQRDKEILVQLLGVTERPAGLSHHLVDNYRFF